VERTRAVQRIVLNPLLCTIVCIVHRFLGQTIPEHRVTLYNRCTDALLYEWDRAKFPEGSAVGKLDAQQKRVLLRGIACRMHEAHVAEIPRADVEAQFAEVLPSLGRPANEASQIVDEIRDRSGLLVERREGYFGFSHLTFQEYFAAIGFVAAKRGMELVEYADDPWWEEVIVLSAGVSHAEPARLILGLLQGVSPRATFLAAAALETATDVPVEVRNKVEARVAALVPPRAFLDAERLIRIGPLVTPYLIAALSTARGDERFLAAYVLARLDYEPATAALAGRLEESFDSLLFYAPSVSALVAFRQAGLRQMARPSGR